MGIAALGHFRCGESECVIRGGRRIRGTIPELVGESSRMRRCRRTEAGWYDANTSPPDYRGAVMPIAAPAGPARRGFRFWVRIPRGAGSCVPGPCGNSLRPRSGSLDTAGPEPCIYPPRRPRTTLPDVACNRERIGPTGPTPSACWTGLPPRKSVVASRVGKGRPEGSIELRVSPSPSKIPYGGFFPVRLQMDRQWRPSTLPQGLSAVHIRP